MTQVDNVRYDIELVHSSVNKLAREFKSHSVLVEDCATSVRNNLSIMGGMIDSTNPDALATIARHFDEAIALLVEAHASMVRASTAAADVALAIESATLHAEY